VLVRDETQGDGGRLLAGACNASAVVEALQVIHQRCSKAVVEAVRVPGRLGVRCPRRRRLIRRGWDRVSKKA
jgi:hypothetical protein